MSFIQCPLCGRNVLEANFDPESFEDDVFRVQMQGLGKGKGFRVRERYSILEASPVMERMAERLLTLTDLFVGKGLITKADLESRLGLTSVKKVDSLRSQLGDAERAGDAAEEDRKMALRMIIGRIEEALEDEHEEGAYYVIRDDVEEEEEETDLLEKLRSTLETLIDEYNVRGARLEELDDNLS